MADTPQVRLRARGARRIRSTPHPWIYRDDVVETSAARDGQVVRLVSPRGRFLGLAAYSGASKIALRLLSREDRPIDREFWAERVEAALAHRERVVRTATAKRLIFGEGDGIPGVVADLYGTHLVVQTLTSAAERVLPILLDVLSERLRLDSVLARNDGAVRTLEGLPREIRQIRGTTPAAVEVREGAVRYSADPWRGQKTGAFLDQRENRLAFAEYATGRVLDVFSYHGSFALHAAARAEEVVAVDTSEEAVARGRKNVALNDLANVSFEVDNAFENLRARERRGERFEAIVLDPPAFAKSRAELRAARRGYKEINLRAMRLLAPGGTLMTSSCSYNLSEEALLDTVASAAIDARRAVRVLAKRTQSPDHPIRPGFREGCYLKCLVLNVQ